MKLNIVVAVIVGLSALTSFAADVDYKCIAQTLQAQNSDIFFDLQPSDIDLMLSSPAALGHAQAEWAAQYCANQPAGDK